MQPEFISEPATLATVCEQLAEASHLALDTEFVRVRTYRSVLCLIQINDGKQIRCIDTIAIEDLTPLMSAIDRCPSALVLHAGRQDFEVLYQRAGHLPALIWDTQIAAAMLDMGEQVSYAQLVQSVTGVELDKGHTRTNWARRPLSDGQLRYAADDVLYLPQIQTHLAERLDRLNRLQWLAQECRSLLDVSNYEPAFEQAWRRCKLRRRLTPLQRGAWKRLCELRERRASELDRPRRWLLEDAALEELAVLTPTDTGGITRIVNSGRLRRKLNPGAVRAALTDPPPADDTTSSRPDTAQQALIDSCLAQVRSTATELGISAGLVATRKDITRLVHGDRDLNILRGWRQSVIGDALLKKVCNLGGQRP